MRHQARNGPTPLVTDSFAVPRWTATAFLLVGLIQIACGAAVGKELYVSPDGTPLNEGTRSQPLDLPTALSDAVVSFHNVYYRMIWQIFFQYIENYFRINSIFCSMKE